MEASLSRRYLAALNYATRKHIGQSRIGGAPYISHPVAVAEIVRDWGYGEDYQITALFHDLLEETDATEKELEFLGGAAVLAAVKCLTKTKPYTMESYITGIRSNEISYVVKAADRLHNLRCAIAADDAFKTKYIIETLDWYLSFSPQILPAVRVLADSMEKLPAELRSKLP